MQKIALINPQQNNRHPQPPMGLALLGAILKREGYEVSIIDYNVKPGYILLDVITFDIVGITAMTPTINNALNIARSLKRYNPSLTIILGGAHATLLPSETLKASEDIDIVVTGEGDVAFSEILSGNMKGDIRGIYHSKGEIDMDDLPYLAYHLLPWQEYRPHPPHGRELPWLPMITSRGCPYHCSYCSKAVFGNKFRSQSPKRVVDEIAYYQRRFGVKEITFYDDVFTLDMKRADGIAEEILRRGIKLSWTCETRADLVNRELLSFMKKAGCYSVSYGIESASQDIMDVIDKRISVEKSEEAVRLTREVGMQTIGYFMIGSPNETPETIRETIEFAKRLKLDYAQFAVTVPFPNTKLFEYYRDGKEKVDIPWDSFVYADIGNKTTPVFESPMLSRDDIQNWVSRAYKEFYLRPSYVWQRLSGIRSVGDIKVLAKGLSMLRGM